MPSEDEGSTFCPCLPVCRFMPHRLLPTTLHIFSSALIFPYPSKY
ncbi:TPA: hypothetical protein ACFONS_000343 [Neisseria meningitidis]